MNARYKEFESRFNEFRNNSHVLYFGFEMKDEQNEWIAGYINYDAQNNQMRWNDISVDCDVDRSVEDNIDNLYNEIVSSGKYHENED